ncbi:MAG: hypothetical protein KDA91_08070 [Planctomycetaceae bacterium]|nr:hypothetical protein [Planctomycetaceae bacterium]
MAREESDREDLMREATAFVRRAELQVEGLDQPVTVGFRRTGAFSVFIDQDPVYQFTPDGQLRRAYSGGFLYRSQQGTLARMHRERSNSQTTLIRSDLSESELSSFHDTMKNQLCHIRDCLQAGQVQILRTVPDEFEAVPETRMALQQVLNITDHWIAPPIAPR